ncbi:TPA: restriction endonuclease subunit S [Aeromonas veronii]|uniref:restriction endonuclease subunit S n=1 Tax=Aeromonas TaxID=642 RepID=UPI002B460E05|nr:restriction endonuclease subunit S [Aeromonas caviae]
MKWPMVKLADVCQVNPRLPKEYDETQDVSFLAMASVSEDGILLNQETRVLSETKKGFTYFERGDVIVAKITPCFENGKAAYLDSLQTQVGFGSTEFHVLRPDIKQLDGKYLFYLIWNRKFRFIAERIMSGSAGQKRVPASFLQNFEIPLPPLAEQKRIAAILDKADAIRQKRQQAIALADDFLRSVFLDMFGDPVTNPKGWEIQPISKVAEVQGGLQVTKKREGLPVTCPYLRVANVYRGRLELSEIKTMQVTEVEQERVALVKNDILIVEGHGNKEEIGRCAMWDGSIENMIHQNHLIRVRVINNRVLPQYLTDFINSEGGRGQLIGASNTTSGLNTISTRLVKETAVLIPDLHIQERYIQIFKKVTETLNNFQQGTLEGKGFFESLSQKAFSGQL